VLLRSPIEHKHGRSKLDHPFLEQPDDSDVAANNDEYLHQVAEMFSAHDGVPQSGAKRRQQAEADLHEPPFVFGAPAPSHEAEKREQESEDRHDSEIQQTANHGVKLTRQ